VSQIVSLARSAAALTATFALASPAAALAATLPSGLGPTQLYGRLPSLSATAPARLVDAGSVPTASAGLPKTGADVLPEALIGAAVLVAGAGLRCTTTSKPG
jgi:hypothetical protein